ncbi:DUF6168 family protein [Robiginitalea sp. M366]|uniref:DUF6168 family protein n=1 Tax=Robiginitalea aestuariiviva TaxID=3036903 RepID=UPI00240D9C46|nr:DUF6168 family protein [Robiginitalea aestuariiviva]MDG1571449.1 DUF6168 family protein [Robiginitalea aestuariiviva]
MKVGFLSRFFGVLLLAMGLVLAGHAFIRAQMGLPALGDLLPRSYTVNFVLAFGIVAVLYVFRQRASHYLGFLFIGGSLLKFLAFFLLIYPELHADDTLSRAEFFSFFAPYLTALVLEVVFASGLLRQLEKEETP